MNAAKGTVSAKKTTSSTKKTTASSSQQTVKVTSAEKKLLELYRAADSDTKKAALKVLKGEESAAEDILENLLESVQDMLSGKS